MLYLFGAKIRLFLVTSKVFGGKYSEGGKEKNRRLRNGESPVEYCCFDDETKDYLLKFPTLVYRAFLSP